MITIEPQLSNRCDKPGRLGQWGASAGLTLRGTSTLQYARALVLDLGHTD